jgi:hypothetical protein
MTSEPTLHLRAPVAVIRIAMQRGTESRSASPDDLIARLLDCRGFHYVDENLLVVATSPGDEAVFDAAVGEVGRIQRSLRDREDSDQSVSVLVAPGVAEFGPGGPRLVNDTLLEDLGRKAPAHGPGIYLTGRAASALEMPPTLEQVPSYQGPSGKVVPLFRTGGLRLDRLPWRNPTVFDQAPPYVPRAAAEKSARSLLDEPSFRVCGPMGSGKFCSSALSLVSGSAFLAETAAFRLWQSRSHCSCSPRQRRS